MINIYDIGRDKELHPALVKIGNFNVKREITMENNTLINFIKDYMKLEQYDNEHLYLLALDMYDRALGVFLLGIGDYKSCIVSKRNIAECLVLSGARHFLVLHNHPDGALSLSDGDMMLADEMEDLALLFDITFLGNFVVTYEGIVSSGMEKPILFRR